MKKDTHSKDYRLVVFEDSSCNYSFLTRSTVKTDKTVKWEDGNEYPLFKLDISDKSHPYYTCLLYTSPSPRDISGSRMPSSA